MAPFLALELRDVPADPRQGSFHFTSLEVGSSALGGGIKFVKFRLEDSWFIPWPPPTVLAISHRLGLGAPSGGTDDLVIEDRFKAGGSTTIRGYERDRVGPLDADGNPERGDFSVILNLEWRFPIWRWLGGVTFFDVGAVTPRVKNFSFNDLYPRGRRRPPDHQSDRPDPPRRGLRAPANPERRPDSGLSRGRPGLLMSYRRAIVIAALLSGLAASAGAAPPLDVLLAQVEVRTVAASDIALARALGVLEGAATTGPIERSDVERFVDVLLMLDEAGRIGLTVDQADVDRGWAALVARVGSEAALERWLALYGIDAGLGPAASWRAIL